MLERAIRGFEKNRLGLTQLTKNTNICGLALGGNNENTWDIFEMNKNLALLLLVTIGPFMFTELTLANSSVYECVVKTEYRLNDTGIIT